MTIHDHTGLSSGGHERPPVVSAGGTQPSSFMTPWKVAVAAVVGVLLIDAGGTDNGPGFCIFRRCTGGYCPGCGMTRAARHLTRGQIGAAWQDHPVVVLVAAQTAIAATLYAAVRPLRDRLRASRTLAYVAGANGVLLIIVWVIRLVDGSIPRFF